MSKKIDIREIHTTFEHLLFERDALLSSNLTSPEIDDLDKQLLEMITTGIYSGVAFSERMNTWRPHSLIMSQSLKNDFTIDTEYGKITVQEALSRKIEKERKFKEVQNWSMFACTILLVLYYVIVGWWL